jgi:hypothetical protein
MEMTWQTDFRKEVRFFICLYPAARDLDSTQEIVVHLRMLISKAGGGHQLA